MNKAIGLSTYDVVASNASRVSRYTIICSPHARRRPVCPEFVLTIRWSRTGSLTPSAFGVR